MTPRQREALELVATGHTVDECAAIMRISRSSVEKLLAGVKRATGARSLRHAIYLACKSGVIILCCYSAFDADEMRRVNRSRQRESIVLVEIV
mgnify:CR=1 FL=1